jgi:hypothetical protein
MLSLKVGDIFPSMQEARLSITSALKDDGQSYWTVKSDTALFVLKCKSVKDQAEDRTRRCKFKVYHFL